MNYDCVTSVCSYFIASVVNFLMLYVVQEYKYLIFYSFVMFHNKLCEVYVRENLFVMQITNCC
jgi:hypothetical protein